MKTQNAELVTAEGSQPASTFRGYLRHMGPGIVVALLWIGSGDLVNSAVAGANYGYALLWGLVIAVLSRYLFVSATARYVLCNSVGDTSIMQGFGRIWRWLPISLGLATLLLTMVFESYLLNGVGGAVVQLLGGTDTGGWTKFLASAVVAGVALGMVFSKRRYVLIDIVARVAAVALIGTFVVAAIISGPNPVEVLRGVLFEVPASEGVFGASLVVIALIGTTGGSIPNLMYPYFLKDKGWQGPKFLRMQRYDLRLAVAVIIVLNVAIWIVAAETFKGTGRTIEGESDLADMMEMAVGPLGPTLLWIGVFFIVFTTIGPLAMAVGRVVVDGFHSTLPSRRERYDGDLDADPIFKLVPLVMLSLPLFFSLPGSPNFVVLTIVGGSITVLTAPIVMFGVIWLSTRKHLMLPGHTQRWHTLIPMYVVAIVGIWAVYQVIRSWVS